MAGVRALSAPFDEYLCAAGRRHWAWGEIDCFLFVADWVERITGIDCAGDYRGTYTSEREARRLIKDNGGPIAFADALLGRAGCVATEHPKAGDVALVRLVFGRGAVPQASLVFPRLVEDVLPPRRRIILGPVGAICRRPQLWAVKPSDAPGLAFGNFPVIRAWALPNA
jgi:hypothetical protein